MDLLYPEWFEKKPELIRFIESKIDKPVQWLFIGDNGTGKTAIAEVIFNSFVEANKDDHRISYLATTASDLYRRYLSANALTGKEQTEAISRIEKSMSYDFLLIDELGGEMDTESSRAFFTNYLCHQYDYFREKDKTYSIITTNLDSEKLAQRYGKKVIDRFYEFYTFVSFEGMSYRLKMKKVMRFK
jgi:DNA replication protein DnaC